MRISSFPFRRSEAQSRFRPSGRAMVMALTLLAFPFGSAASSAADDAPKPPQAASQNAAEAEATEPSAADQPAADKPAADQPAADQPAADQPAADQPAADKPAADKPAADKPAADKPAADKPAADKPAADKPAGDPRPLSVAPLSQVEYPADRPAWVDAPPTLGGVSGAAAGDAGAVDVWPVKSLLRPSAAEARESLQVQMQGAAAAYAEQFLGSERAQRLPKSIPLVPEMETLPAEDRYVGTAVLGDQTVYEQAVRLRFDEAYRQRLAGEWRGAEVGLRLKWLGVAGAGGLVLLLSATGLVRRSARHRNASHGPVEPVA